MELLLIAAVIALLRWVAGKMSVEEEEPAPLPPPAPAPRPRRSRRAEPPRLPEPAAASPEPRQRADFRPPVAAPAVQPSPRRVSPYARDFRDAASLRRAVVAREVLGPPLSLRGR
ncbi:MAG: hypothetical protein ACK5VI_05250 [Opitutia bacterium]|jgi:hypothetical protein